MLGGNKKRFLITFAASTIGSAGLLLAMSATGWFANPGLGFFGVCLITLGAGFLVTFIATGLSNRKSLYSALIGALVVVVSYYPLQQFMNADNNLLTVLFMIALLVGLSAAGAIFISKEDRRINARSAGLTAFLGSLVLILDRLMQEFSNYTNSDAVRGRPVPTIGQVNDLLDQSQLSNFWVVSLDAIMHLILPTVALTLISFAGYLRFSRGSLLEVMNLDFIRTARAKGLPERTVIVRHALRNAMLPLTTILVNDFAGVLGGAIITESVFGWKGMGQLFNGALRTADLNLFMGVFVITAFLTVFANLVADLLFGLVDPRIRLRK
jgi:peptide/nickel transport system permease protein